MSLQALELPEEVLVEAPEQVPEHIADTLCLSDALGVARPMGCADSRRKRLQLSCWLGTMGSMFDNLRIFCKRLAGPGRKMLSLTSS